MRQAVWIAVEKGVYRVGSRIQILAMILEKNFIFVIYHDRMCGLQAVIQVKNSIILESSSQLRVQLERFTGNFACFCLIFKIVKNRPSCCNDKRGRVWTERFSWP